MNKKKILITGGCGYVGSLLVDTLRKKNYSITVLDTLWFGKNLPKDKSIKFIKEDIRNTDKINLKGFNTVIHLTTNIIHILYNSRKISFVIVVKNYYISIFLTFGYIIEYTA